ncbi:multidrug resistance-associated ABC transporter [Gymnopilus junonius]|uniref:Multidrug resistance-associated ABC transporter n=1 Tax=Gymnopilus junonius TaxID=109634 RepID=A0A9P5NH03_GYMJU|nr:multidrug resistance-associated ABC transporter [Gymnopilus junonius]
MKVCEGRGLFDLSNACIRASWNAVVPAGLVFLFCLGLLPLPRPLHRLFKFLGTPFQSFLTIHEAEAIDNIPTQPFPSGDGADEEALLNLVSAVPVWRTSALVVIGALETVFWVILGAQQLHTDKMDVWSGILSVLLGASWIYAVVRSVVCPPVTAPYDLFSLYMLFFATGILQLGGAVYDQYVFGLPSPPILTWIGMTGNLFAIVFLLVVVMDIPRAIPSSKIDPKEIGNTISTEDYSTIWQWLSFSWIYPFIKRGRNTNMHEADVWNLSPNLRSHPLFVKFNSIRHSTLLHRIWAANSQDLILDFIFTMMSVMFNYASPFFLKHILDAIDEKNPTPEGKAKAYIYSFLAFLCTLLKAQADAQHLWFGRRASVRLRSELMASIYDKALKRRDFSGVVDKDKGKDGASDSQTGADIGKIVNLMSNDCNRVTPVEIAVACVFLYQLLGFNAFAGFAVLVIVWPLNSFLGRRSVKIHKGVMAANDKLMGVLNELIGAIKFIKYFAWEERWIDRVMEAREAELSWIVKARINAIMLGLLSTIAPIFVSVLTFTVYILNANELTISTAFTASQNEFIEFTNSLLQYAGVAVNRIAVYLEEDEVTEQVSTLKREHSGPHLNTAQEEGLGLENATLKWNEAPDPSVVVASDSDNNDNVSERTVGEGGERLAFELKEISVRFPVGKMTVVTGPTASGKSALLMAVLGEMTLLSGKIIMSKDSLRVDENGLMHCISYAAQHPWLRHQSIKDNILFGYPYDEERYTAVVECCALMPDLEMLEDGDATEIGARGVNLSGGQKARVALARAIYARTKYVLLDDPLSAVDSHSSRFLFDRLLCGPLLANRTVVLVTHHVELVLPGAHYLVRMLDGRIDTQGTVADLRARGLLEGIERDSSTDVPIEKQFERQAEVIAVEEIMEVESKPLNKTKKPRKLIKDEHRETGGVKWSIYKSYLKASSYWIWGILACIVIINQFIGIAEKLWVRTWGEAYRNETAAELYQPRIFISANGESSMDHHFIVQQPGQFSVSSTVHGVPATASLLNVIWPNAAEHPFFYIGIYAAISFTGAFVTFISVASQYTGALRASRILFRCLLVSIVRATFRFHDTTPTGRILNRFGKDIDTIDSSLASSLQSVNTATAGFLAAILTVAVIFPYFIIPAFFIGLAYHELAIGYLNTGRDLRRMESTTRSPIYSHFGELLEGIVTIRAFSAERRFLDGLHSKIDITTKMWYMFWMTNRWLLLNFDSLGAVIVLLTMIFSIATLKNDAGLAAVCITSAMTFTLSVSNPVYWTCRYWTTLELDLNLEVPQEPPAIIESNRVPAYWPSSSNTKDLLVVENLQVKYASDLPAVLNDISFTLKAGERVGLLGRTGSGKSTLATSIMRFVEPTQGKIVIDGFDISTIGIHDLRSRLTFIPQDATLFSGTLRDNLDPFGDYSDAECLDVLYRVHLIADKPESIQSNKTTDISDPEYQQTVVHTDNSDSISTTTTTVDVKASICLDTQVSAGGTNFSQGQRQLIAMARALLRRSSIIILDEATSSIDFATDAKIQTTIREEFTSSLLLTVAHRLRTIIDYDHLIVLDKGSVVEFDTPWNLINKENGFFRTMCLKSGTFNELETAAKEAQLKNQRSSA